MTRRYMSQVEVSHEVLAAASVDIMPYVHRRLAEQAVRDIGADRPWSGHLTAGDGLRSRWFRLTIDVPETAPPIAPRIDGGFFAPQLYPSAVIEPRYVAWR